MLMWTPTTGPPFLIVETYAAALVRIGPLLGLARAILACHAAQGNRPDETAELICRHMARDWRYGPPKPTE